MPNQRRKKQFLSQNANTFSPSQSSPVYVKAAPLEATYGTDAREWRLVKLGALDLRAPPSATRGTLHLRARGLGAAAVASGPSTADAPKSTRWMGSRTAVPLGVRTQVDMVCHLGFDEVCQTRVVVAACSHDCSDGGPLSAKIKAAWLSWPQVYDSSERAWDRTFPSRPFGSISAPRERRKIAALRCPLKHAIHRAVHLCDS